MPLIITECRSACLLWYLVYFFFVLTSFYNVLSTLGDYESCQAYCNNALDLLGCLMDDDPNLKHKRQITVYVASAFRKLGRYSEAMDCCEVRCEQT